MKVMPKQALFVAEYLIDGNATRAAIAAGYSEESAHVIGNRLLRNVKVAAAIAARQGQRMERLEITADRVLQELGKLAFFDPGRLYDPATGKQIPIHRLDEMTRAAVAGVEDETTANSRKQRVKFADKGQNLERIGRYFKMFTDRKEIEGRLTLEELISGATEDDDEVDSGGSQKAS